MTTKIAGEEIPEVWNVILHRQKALERSGYPLPVAMTLAERTEVDLHLACELLERGATLQQALGILL